MATINTPNMVSEHGKDPVTLDKSHPETSHRHFDLESQRASALSDIDKEIRDCEHCIESSSPEDPDLVTRLKDIGRLCYLRYESYHDKKDLDISIGYVQRAMDCISVDPDEMTDLLATCIARNRSGFDQVREVRYIDDAIQLCSKAITTMENSGRAPTDPILEQTVCFVTKFYHTRETTDLLNAIHHSKVALEIMPENHEHHRLIIYHLGELYSLRYLEAHKQNGAGELDPHSRLERQEASDLLESDRLWESGKAIKEWIKKKPSSPGAMENLELAVVQIWQSLEHLPNDQTIWKERLHTLGNLYVDKYAYGQVATNLDVAIVLVQDAIRNSPSLSQPKVDWQLTLANAQHHRYNLKRNKEDLEGAIKTLDECMALIKVGGEGCGAVMDKLGQLWRSQYLRLGMQGREHLDRSIRYHEDAIKWPSTDRMESLRREMNLAGALSERYRFSGASEDLDAAILTGTQAVKEMEVGSADRHIATHNLGCEYLLKYYRDRKIEDAEGAVHYCKESVDNTSARDPSRALRLLSLGRAYQVLHDEGGQYPDIEQAIIVLSEARESIPMNHQEWPGLCCEIAKSYDAKYDHTRDETDLHRAATTYSDLFKFYDSSCVEDINITRYIVMYGTLVCRRASKIGQAVDGNSVLSLLQKAQDDPSSGLDTQYTAGGMILWLLSQNKHWKPAHDRASKTIRLLPLLAPPSLRNSDKQHRLIQTMNSYVFEAVSMASDAASIAVNAKAPIVEAVEALETGRGVIMANRHDTWHLHKLNEKDPQLAAEYSNLCSRLDSSSEYTSSQRFEAEKQLQNTINKIRKIHELDRFLLAPSGDEMREAASDGTIVAINVSSLRCDAFIIEANREIQSVSLPALHLDDIKRRAEKLRNTRVDTEMLEWLWDTVAKPILDHLGLSPVSNDAGGEHRWPRVWWIPTGLLASFPLHAAGYHARQPRDSVMDRVVSSYSTSVRAILQGRRQQQQNRVVATTSPSSSSPSGPPSPPRMVLVGMPTTPGYPSLPYVSQEITKLKAIFGSKKSSNLSQTNIIEPTPPIRAELLRALEPSSQGGGCDLFHFAGHGESNPSNPLQSSLLLRDWETDLLTVDTLLQQEQQQRGTPYLAYLSACRTSDVNPQSRLTDENLHLVGAFQVAGFRNVIGALWAVNDRACAEVALGVYERMGAGGSDVKQRWPAEAAAVALHATLRDLRDKWLSGAVVVRGGKDDDDPLEESLTQLDMAGTTRTVDHEERKRRKLEKQKVAGGMRLGMGPLHWAPYVHFGA